MDRTTLAELLDVSVLDRLDRIDDLPTGDLARSAALRKEGFSAEVTAALLTQAQLRTEAVGKLGPYAAEMLFTRDGLAQATRLPVAAHHAQRLLAAGRADGSDSPVRIADLGCGIGVDAFAFAGLGAEVRAVDADEVTAAIAAFNLRHLPGAEVAHGLAEDAEVDDVDALWFDPARRRVGRANARGATARIADPDEFSPSLTWVVDRAAEAHAAGVKLGPALDHDLIPAGAEAQWVSHDGDVVEVCLYFGAARQRPGRSALVMGERTLLVHEDDVPATDEDGIGRLGEYLLEPDGAIVRAGLVRALTGPLQARRLNPSIAYLTTDVAPVGPAAAGVTAYKIVDVLPAKIPSLRKELIARGIGSVVIKKRGADIVPDQVRRQLKLPKGERATLVFTRLGDKHVVLLTQPVTESGTAPES
ncbi:MULTISPECIES: class I SAM-dependent methyltransferase [unclassified Brevibacterium]|uniref:class I SAM-dependent methyltransferase n=1 Tax=unclassified Brevibacterium TaxID=2614124 RepID=UPI0010F5A899|nr:MULTISPECIES: class I SAM-dependent methyltransferase [unclassified Brevibacterium]MCM1011698.1 class I SAM-dependent methyltransferase [Brevibacterium sp. XM4083]